MIGAIHQVPLIGVTRSRVEAAISFIAGLSQRGRIRRQQGAANDPAFRRLEAVAHPGRPIGRTEGTWVTDCAEIQQCVLLCSFCDHKFKPSHRKYGYWRDRNSPMGVGGQCDGCRTFQDTGIQLYIHESNVGRSYTAR